MAGAVTHPSTVVAVALLALNDHVLKARWPGTVTGKLSDVAGLYAFPILLAALLGRAGVRRPGAPAFAATAAAFTLVKTWPPATALTDQVLTVFAGPSHVRRDATDLVALVALVPAWRLWARSAGEAAERWWRRAAGAVVLIAGLSASVATAPYLEEESVERVEVRGQSVIAFNEYGSAEWESDTGGRSWYRLGYEDTVPAGARRPMQQAVCLAAAPDQCFRVVEGVAVEERVGGGDWTVAFALPPEAGHGRRHVDVDGGVDEHDLDHTFLGLIEAYSSDGPTSTLIVAMGTEGILRRSPEGVWEQVGLGDARPIQDVERGDGNDSIFLDSFFLVPLVAGGSLFAAAGIAGLVIVVRGRRRVRAAGAGGDSLPPPPPSSSPRSEP